MASDYPEVIMHGLCLHQAHRRTVSSSTIVILLQCGNLIISGASSLFIDDSAPYLACTAVLCCHLSHEAIISAHRKGQLLLVMLTPNKAVT